MKILRAGSTSISADDLAFVATQCPVNNTGIFYCGTAFPAPGRHSSGFPAPGIQLFDGIQCAGGDVRRFQPVSQGSGSAADTGFVAQAGTYFVPGAFYYFQYWSRDVSSGESPCGKQANFSPAYAVEMTP